MLGAEDLRGLYAIIPTPTTDDGARVDAENTVDLTETARVVNRLIVDGADGLIVLGTTGEAATITREEYEPFVDCVLSTVHGRVPTFVGTTQLGTHEVVKRTKFAKERGADGILLGLPMWQPLTTDGAVKYYAGISALFPDLSIMVYGNPRAFRYNFPPEFWSRAIVEAPTVMSAKFSRPPFLAAAQEAAGGKVHFLPNEGALQKFCAISRETTTACWSTAASMGPEPALAMIRAVLDGDRAREEAVAKDLAWAGEPAHAITKDPEVFASYNIQLEKTRINAAGYCKAGPIRPPYDVMPEEFVKAAEENGKRWTSLRKKYAAVPAR